jgi:hypothetical protein
MFLGTGTTAKFFFGGGCCAWIFSGPGETIFLIFHPPGPRRKNADVLDPEIQFWI